MKKNIVEIVFAGLFVTAAVISLIHVGMALIGGYSYFRWPPETSGLQIPKGCIVEVTTNDLLTSKDPDRQAGFLTINCPRPK